MSEPKQDELVAACEQWIRSQPITRGYCIVVTADTMSAFVRSRIAQALQERAKIFTSWIRTGATAENVTVEENESPEVMLVQLVNKVSDQVVAQARLEAFQQFRRELVGGTLPHEEKDLTMQIKQILLWADSRIAELRQLAEHTR